MALLETVAVAFAQVEDGGHVDIVEGRQHGRAVLRLLQPLGDAAAQAGHAHPDLAFVVGARRRRGRLRRGRPGCCNRFVRRRLGFRHWRGFRFGRGCLRRQVSLDIGLEQAAVLAGAFDFRRVEIVFGDQLAHGRAERRRLGLRFRLRVWFRFGRCRRRCFRSGRHGNCRSGLVDPAEHRANFHFSALAGHDLGQDAGRRRIHFQRDLVGLQLDERFVRLDSVAHLFEPFGDLGFRHRFAERGTVISTDMGYQRSCAGSGTGVFFLSVQSSNVSASSTSRFCSATWRALRPVAGEADSGRPA